MVILTTRTPYWGATPPRNSYNHKFKRRKFSNSMVFLNHSSKTSFWSANMDPSCNKIHGLPLLAEEADRTDMGENAKICKYCEMGDLRTAVELLSRSKKSQLELNTYCSVLQLCAELKSLEQGKRVHKVIKSNGLVVEGALGAKLVFMYASCGDLREGRRIFDQVLGDKVFLWNFMMSEYAKTGDYEESLYLFKKMLMLNVEANSYTLTCVLKCLAALGNLEEGERIHGYLYKLGFGSYNTVVNSLITFYSKCSRVEIARKLFDGLSDRDVISWNSMISAYVQNDFSEDGLEIFQEMLRLGIELDLVTMLNALVACANIGNFSFGSLLHAHGIKTCYDRKLMFRNTLLDMYSKCGDLASVVKVFEDMDEKTVVSWTSVMVAYVREGLYSHGINLFFEMESAGVKPDGFALTSVLHACACSCSLESGKHVHHYIKENNMASNLPVANALMDMYAKCGSMEDACLVFSQIGVKDITSWNTMIGGYSKNSLPNEAINLFTKMQKELKPDGVTLACVLPACGSLAALERGRELHCYMLRNGLSSDLHVANALLDMYVKCGVLVLAQLLFDMNPEKDLVSWTVMIAGYGMHGCGKEAIATFNEMKNVGVEPDEVSFISMLYACSHSGLVDEGWKFFGSMRNEYMIQPKLEHYACMVDLLSRSGKLLEAYKFIENMPIKPDATIWGSLLCGCRTYHNVELAEKVAEHVFELEPENTGYYVLLANIYAEAQKWEEVKKVRQRIGKKGLKKNPGSSWIEVRGKVNVFVAGDRSHPQAKKLDSLLRQLRMKMKKEGCIPNMKYALINADDMEKEVALCGHSEKLAMALGVLTLPPGRTIRVTKNLRVCGDCHEMAKFISKETKREIVLRDSNRFHHFKHGMCSCRGFW